MYLLRLKTFSNTASFRIPENHTFQKTLPLPPLTTLTGIMGAALGLNFQNSMRYKKNNGIHFGIIGINNGEMKDLWKYKKIKSKEVIKDVLIREYLVDFEMTLIIGAYNKNILKEIREAFLNPYYALSTGNSDDILKIKSIDNISEFHKEDCYYFRNTIIPGDLTTEYESQINLKETPITYKVRAPQAFLLPVAFNFSKNERRVSKKEYFTFIGSPIKLKNPIEAYSVDGDNFALL